MPAKSRPGRGARSAREDDVDYSAVRAPANRIAEIRDLAAAELDTPTDSFDGAAFEAELLALAPDDAAQRDPDFLEALSLVILRAGRRPRRADKLIYRLYQECIAAHDLDRFNAFKARLIEAESRGLSLEGVYFPSTFAELDQGEVFRDLLGAIGRVRQVVGEVFINSGTLLGMVREGALISYDDDIDLGLVLGTVSSPEEAAERWHAACTRLVQAGLAKAQRGVSRNPSVIKLQSGGSYNIDLFPSWVQDGRVHVYPHTAGDLVEDQVLPLIADERTGLPMPRKPKAMLAVNYGPGWKVPDPGFKFSWPQANRRFKAFRTSVKARFEASPPGAGQPAQTSAAPDLLAAPGIVHLPHKRKYRIGITYGTFDLFHVGHVRLLQRLAELADRVIVGCSTDEFNAGKGKACVIPYQDRVEILQSCRFVSQVIPEESWEQKAEDIRRYGAEVFAMGYDWAGKFDELKAYCDVVYLPRTDGVSTTHLKTVMRDWEKHKKK